ncbi:hypothetical protein [uncultured Corynebacterium sp.]|uniref:hypothetical protein n=1 Tax=uncultured Corynebacterium sp. TaxID=159447 RepID=UPI00260CFBA5|nr:hypothetical protein [uncultured Corynebacterium sp.]
MPEAGGRPRTAVLAECWAAAGIDAPALCNKAGAPVARAVKCLVDPLIVRPRLRPHLSAPLLDDAAAAELTDLLGGARDRLRDASAWFTLLRAARRRRRITDGNAQELYFPRAFELAVTVGDPGTCADADAECDRVLAEVHPDEATAEDIAAHLARREVAAAYADRIADGWAPRADDAGPDLAWIAGVLWQVLDEDPATGEDDAATWDDLVDSGECGTLGMGMRSRAGLVGKLLGEFESPDTSVTVSASDPLAPPAIDGDGLGVLDRSVASRCRAALRRARETTWVADAADLADTEVERARTPFGLADPANQAAFAAGVTVGAGLFPLNPNLPEGPLLIRDLQARLRKEAYIMHLRRQLARGNAIDARQERVVGQLAEFWAPYLRRLWPRLHGLDVMGQPPADADDMRELLSGVARSVVYDQRQQIRTALEAAA